MYRKLSGGLKGLTWKVGGTHTRTLRVGATHTRTQSIVFFIHTYEQSIILINATINNCTAFMI